MADAEGPSPWPHLALTLAAALLTAHLALTLLEVARGERLPPSILGGGLPLVAGLALLAASASSPLRASRWTHLGLGAVLAAFVALVLMRVALGGRWWGDEADLLRIVTLAAVVLPPFLLRASSEPSRWTVALQAVGGTVLAAALVWVAAAPYRALPDIAWRLHGTQLSALVLLVAGMWSALASLPRHRFAGMLRDVHGRWTPRVLALGGVLLAYGWTLGQSPTIFGFFWPVVWWLPLLVLALPLLTRVLTPPYDVDLPRVSAVVLAVLAFLPVGGPGRCEAVRGSDVELGGSITWTQVRLIELAGHGPLWRSGVGLGGVRVNCQPWIDALAILWLAGLVGASWWVGRQATARDAAASTDG